MENTHTRALRASKRLGKHKKTNIDVLFVSHCSDGMQGLPRIMGKQRM